jgi:hypothetical protein
MTGMLVGRSLSEREVTTARCAFAAAIAASRHPLGDFWRTAVSPRHSLHVPPDDSAWTPLDKWEPPADEGD